jgi:hypothetical protein
MSYIPSKIHQFCEHSNHVGLGSHSGPPCRQGSFRKGCAGVVEFCISVGSALEGR